MLMFYGIGMFVMIVLLGTIVYRDRGTIKELKTDELLLLAIGMSVLVGLSWFGLLFIITYLGLLIMNEVD